MELDKKDQRQRGSVTGTSSLFFILLNTRNNIIELACGRGILPSIKTGGPLIETRPIVAELQPDKTGSMPFISAQQTMEVTRYGFSLDASRREQHLSALS
jgi:hypothetical protein